jgi:CRP-like cAMP-binding protein
MLGEYNTRFEIPETILPHARQDTGEMVATVKSLGILVSGDAGLHQLLRNARRENWREGQALLEPGKVAEVVHIVVQGRARAVFVDGGTELQLHEFGRGQLILAKASLRGNASPYLLRAASELEVIAVPIADFKAFSATDAQLAQEIEQMLSAREEAAGRALAKVLPDRRNGEAGSDRVQILRDMFRT